MADPRTKRYVVAFNAQLDEAEKKMLEALATRLGISQGAVVRNQIQKQFRMTFGAEPACANGHACLCPQMQMQQGTNPQTNEAILDAIQTPPTHPPAQVLPGTN